MKKVKVNLIYRPQHKPAEYPRFENEQGQLWMNPSYDPNADGNIGMSFYSCSGPNYPNIDYPDLSIMVVEPRTVVDRDYHKEFLINFKHIFTWCTKLFEGTELEHKVVPLNHGSCFGTSIGGYENFKKCWVPWNERKNEIVFIANNKRSDHYSELYSLRTRLADWLHENSKQYKVRWYSQIPLQRDYYCGPIADKNEILRQVKFSVCSENTYDPLFSWNYFTEKMPECWFGSAVPLYMGCWNINDFNFHPNSYIDLRNYVNKDKYRMDISFNDILLAINNFTEQDYNNYLNAIDHNVYVSKLFDIISEERVMAKMIETFYNKG